MTLDGDASLPARVGHEDVTDLSPKVREDAGGKLGKCQWLHGDAHDRNFCGRQTKTLLCSWCDEHAALVLMPLKDASREEA